ncbi:MAG: hypothetical protein KJ994_06025, partial [Candidatus Omnitrophica bacterium]|nr:hypothetical protein [Candidatus Omnitrophota bacterium]
MASYTYFKNIASNLTTGEDPLLLDAYVDRGKLVLNAPDDGHGNRSMPDRRIKEINKIIDEMWASVDKTSLPQYIRSKAMTDKKTGRSMPVEDLQKTLFALSALDPATYKYLEDNNVRITIVETNWFSGSTKGENFFGMIARTPRGASIELKEQNNTISKVWTLVHEAVHHKKGDVARGYFGLYLKTLGHIKNILNIIFQDVPSYEIDTFNAEKEFFKKILRMDVSLESLSVAYLGQRWVFGLLSLATWIYTIIPIAFAIRLAKKYLENNRRQNRRVADRRRRELIKVKAPVKSKEIAPIVIDTADLKEIQRENLDKGLNKANGILDTELGAAPVNVEVYENISELAALEEQGIQLSVKILGRAAAEQPSLGSQMAVALSVYHEKLHDLLRGHRARDALPSRETELYDELYEEIFVVSKTLEYLCSDKVSPEERIAYLDFLEREPAINNANFKRMAAEYEALLAKGESPEILQRKIPLLVAKYAKRAYARDWGAELKKLSLDLRRKDVREKILAGFKAKRDALSGELEAALPVMPVEVVIVQPPEVLTAPAPVIMTDIQEKMLRAFGEVRGIPADRLSYRKGQLEALKAMEAGSFAELRTGGGKTLMLAGTALEMVEKYRKAREEGKKVLIMTHEDNLTEQAMSQDKMGVILSRCGAIAGFIVPRAMPDGSIAESGVIFENGSGREATVEEVFTRCDIIYGKWDRFVHRHMKEKIGADTPTMNKNKYFALFDEADLTLVFGSATPCIISGNEMTDALNRLAMRRAINDIVKSVILEDKGLYYAPEGTREAYLTDGGERSVRKAIGELFKDDAELAKMAMKNWKAFAIDALNANLFYREGEQYFQRLDARGKLVGIDIRDENTNARKTGMSFGEGLQQAVEIAAGIDDADLTRETYTSMSMTISQFLSGDMITDYAGASGTMERDRFEAIYKDKSGNKKTVTEIQGESRRLDKSAGHKGFDTKKGKWEGLVAALPARINANQPILIKVESDTDMEYLREYIKSNLAELID